MSKFSDDGYCFVCGPKNPIGLKLDFIFDGNLISASFTPKKEHQGYKNIVHGGIISTLLDEIMVKLAIATGMPAVTAQINIKLKKAASVGEKILLTAEIRRETRKTIDAYAKAMTNNNEVVAEAKGKLIKIKAGEKEKRG